MDKLYLDEVSVYGFHGALPEERVLGQRYVTSVVFELDTRHSAATDDLAATIDYRRAIAIVQEVVSGEPVKLIETLAERIATRLLGELALARAVTVRVVKPRPPVAAEFTGVAIEIRRERAPA